MANDSKCVDVVQLSYGNVQLMEGGHIMYDVSFKPTSRLVQPVSFQ